MASILVSGAEKVLAGKGIWESWTPSLLPAICTRLSYELFRLLDRGGLGGEARSMSCREKVGDVIWDAEDASFWVRLWDDEWLGGRIEPGGRNDCCRGLGERIEDREGGRGVAAT